MPTFPRKVGKKKQPAKTFVVHVALHPAAGATRAQVMREAEKVRRDMATFVGQHLDVEVEIHWPDQSAR